MTKTESSEAFRRRLIAFERRLQDDMQNIFCPTHLCLGQEEVPVELHECLQPADWLFSTHRAHGHYLAKGGDEQKLWDEIHGLETGINGGFAGSQSFSDESVNFHCSAIVGGLVGVAAGVAYSLKLNRSSAIVVCCVGDGATEQGVFWETLNFAALHRLPMAFICENNGKSVDARIEERQFNDLTHRVGAFGIACWGHIGGVRGAIALARRGVPSFYEAKVKLACDHLNMSTLLPTIDYAGAA